jgi:hypothetical protein
MLGLININVCGPINVRAICGYTYFIIFTNDDFRYGYVY